jgi:hypothetical protein
MDKDALVGPKGVLNTAGTNTIAMVQMVAL